MTEGAGSLTFKFGILQAFDIIIPAKVCQQSNKGE
mgnify:CR=1 FL=1|jgi:hypothetical protein